MVFYAVFRDPPLVLILNTPKIHINNRTTDWGEYEKKTQTDTDGWENKIKNMQMGEVIQWIAQVLTTAA